LYIYNIYSAVAGLFHALLNTGATKELDSPSMKPRKTQRHIMGCQKVFELKHLPHSFDEKMLHALDT